MTALHMRSIAIPLAIITILLHSSSCRTEKKTDKQGHPDQEIKTATNLLYHTVKEHELAGLSVRLIRNKETSLNFTTGLADTARNIPITDSTIFRIASISKTFTALAMMQLYDQGKANLDVDVSDYLGWQLRNPKHPETPITLRMLMSHQSSLRDGKGYIAFAADMNDKDLNIRELFSPEGIYFTEDMFADHRPGDYFSYTNCSWGIIASVIEKISGTTFEAYCNAHLFKPMEMDARFDPAHIANTDNIAVLYRAQNDLWAPQADHFNGERPEPKTDSTYIPGGNGLIYGPQGGLRCSVNDLEKIARLFWDRGKYKNQQLLKPSSLEEMTREAYRYNGHNGDTWDGFFLSYGLGTHLITATPEKDVIFPGITMAGHPGIAYGLLSDLYFDPQGGNAVIFVTNGSKKEFTYGSKSTFYQPEEDVFSALQPLLEEAKQTEEHRP